jgi:hypothetical protein
LFEITKDAIMAFPSHSRSLDDLLLVGGEEAVELSAKNDFP